MKIISLITSGLFVMILLLLSSCIRKRELPPTVPPPPTPLEDYYVIGEKNMTKHNYTIKLLIKEDLKVGYNKIAVQVYTKSTSTLETNASVWFWPMFKAATTTTSCPVPYHNYDPEYATHFAEVIFTEPTGPQGSWTMEIGANERGGETANTDTATFSIPVLKDPDSSYFNFVYTKDQWTDPEYYYVAVRDPAKAIKGLNPFEVLIHKKKTDTWYPGEHALKLKMKVTNVATGDTSTNNTIPVYKYDGNYIGKLHLTEIGKWRVNLQINNYHDELLYKDGAFVFEVK